MRRQRARDGSVNCIRETNVISFQNYNMIDDPNIVFIIGSPRSGTTILGETIGKHPNVANWYEPYFIMYYHIGNREDDVLEKWDATETVKSFIAREFRIYRRRSNALVVLDKTPGNVFRVPFVKSIFPRAKWIHVLRDGRAVTASINHEWNKRREIIKKRRLRNWLGVAAEMLSLQPYMRNKLQAVWFESKHRNWFGPDRLLNKSKWQGYLGWGPRYAGWKSDFEQHGVLKFNALQWVQTLEAAQANRPHIDLDCWLEVRYEDIVRNPAPQMRSIYDFLGVPLRPESDWVDLNAKSLGKWRSYFSPGQLDEIMSVAGPMLEKLGYVSSAHTRSGEAVD